MLQPVRWFLKELVNPVTTPLTLRSISFPFGTTDASDRHWPCMLCWSAYEIYLRCFVISGITICVWVIMNVQVYVIVHHLQHI